MLLSGLIDVLIFLAITSFGAFLTMQFIENPSALQFGSLSFPLGAGILTLLAFFLSWLSLPLNQITVGVFLALALMTSVLFFKSRRHYRSGKQSKMPPGHEFSTGDRWIPAMLWGSLAIILVLAVIVALTRSYAEWDPLSIWSTKGYGIALEGTVLAGNQWGAHGLAYPLNVPLLVTFFRTVSTDMLPGSKLVFVVFYISLLIGCLYFWRKQNVNPLYASLGTLAFATVPIVFIHATTGYTNLPLATYVVLGTLWGVDGLFEQSVKAQWLSGILLGLANWTRIEGIGFSVAVIAALFMAEYVVRKRLIFPWRMFLPSIFISVVWVTFASGYLGGSRAGSALMSLIRNILMGNMHRYVPGVLITGFGKHALSVSIWGFLFPAALLFILLNIRSLSPAISPKAFSLLAAFLIAAIYPAVLAYGASYLMTIPEFPRFIDRSFDRYFLPSAFLFGILGIWMLGLDEKKDPPLRQE